MKVFGHRVQRASWFAMKAVGSDVHGVPSARVGSTSKVRMAISSAGGKLAIFTSAGKVTCEVFNTRHPPDVTDKYAPDAGIGTLGALVRL